MPSQGTDEYDKPFVLEQMSEEAAIAFGLLIILGFFYCLQIVFLFRVGRVASSRVSELRRRQRLSTIDADNVDMPLISTLNRGEGMSLGAALPLVLSRVASLRTRAQTIIDSMRDPQQLVVQQQQKQQQQQQQQQKQKKKPKKQVSGQTSASSGAGALVVNPLHGNEEDSEPKRVSPVSIQIQPVDEIVVAAVDETESFAEQIERLRSMTMTSTASEEGTTGPFLPLREGLSTLQEEGVGEDKAKGLEAAEAINPMHGQDDEDRFQVQQATFGDLLAAMAPTMEEVQEEEERVTSGGAVHRVDSGVTDEEDQEFIQELKRVSSDRSIGDVADSDSLHLSSNRTSETSLPSLVLEIVDESKVVALVATEAVSSGAVSRATGTKITKKKTVSSPRSAASKTPPAAPGPAVTSLVVSAPPLESTPLASRKQTRQQSIIRGLRALKSSVSNTNRLVEVKLGGLNIGDTIAKLISSALRTNRTVTMLDLSNNCIEALGCIELASSLGKLSEMTLAKVSPATSSSPRSARSAGSSGNATSHSPRSPRRPGFPSNSSEAEIYNTMLRHLDLSGNAIGPKGTYALAEALRTNSSLTYLDVGFQTKGKKCGPDGATALATLLHLKKEDGTDVSALQTLRLARSNICFEGCRHLASAILSNTTLTDLDIGAVNYIGISGAMQLGQAICCSPQSRLAWLTVGTRRLPLTALLGDQRLYHAVAAVIKAQRDVSTLIAAAEIGLGAFSVNRVVSGALNLGGALTRETPQQAALAKRRQLALKRAENTLADAEKGLESLQQSSLLTPFPGRLVLTPIQDERYKLAKAFMEKSSHGMDDELGVVVSTLLKRNRTLDHLVLDKAKLPIQALAGFSSSAKPTQRLDLSNRHIGNVDAIIIGSLIADNHVLRLINLRGNEFAATEGENFIAYSLDKNRNLSLDFSQWPKERIFRDGYLALASVQGMSASGAKIEPQRLEGCFYRSVTALAGIQYYANFCVDVYTISIFAANPDIYNKEYVDISSVLICAPTFLYCYNSLRNSGYDLGPALWDCLLAIVQITPGAQAWECVVVACETTAYLDYKFVQGVYKQIPWIWLKTYIMLEVAVNHGLWDHWVLISLLASLLAITMVLIMLYDRKDARRLSYLPVGIQPRLARIFADIFSCIGMGRDTTLSNNFVNYDAVYTAHYCISYVYQLAGLCARVLAISWLCATVDGSYIPMLFTLIASVRIIVMALHDRDTFGRTLYNNSIHMLSLCVTDSAWNKDVSGNQDPVTSRSCYVGLTLLSTWENFAALLYAAFLHPRGTLLAHQTNEGLFSLGCIFIGVRWLLLLHWSLVVHFPELYSGRVSQLLKKAAKK